jgi:hypothetical protein
MAVAIAAEGTAEAHDLRPVEQDGFLQPGVSVQVGSNPGVAGHHLPCDLRIARLIGAKQSNASQAEEEEKSAQPAQQQ